MIAVADTTPICYLILIDEAGLLAKLFTRVLLPPAVHAELLHRDAPGVVREWAANLPTWTSVEDKPVRNNAGLEKLQTGEQATILLAESIEADVVLLDEKSARRIAAGRGLRVMGTLGILSEAASRGLVDLVLAIDRLRGTNFRYSPELLRAILNRFTHR